MKMLTLPIGGFNLQTPYNPEKCIRVLVETPTPFIAPSINSELAQYFYYNKDYGTQMSVANQKTVTLPSLSHVSPENEFCYDYNIIRLVSYRGVILISGDGGSLISVTTQINIINFMILSVLSLIVWFGLANAINAFIGFETGADLYCFVSLIALIIPWFSLIQQVQSGHLKQALREMLSARSVGRREKKKLDLGA